MPTLSYKFLFFFFPLTFSSSIQHQPFCNQLSNTRTCLQTFKTFSQIKLNQINHHD